MRRSVVKLSQMVKAVTKIVTGYPSTKKLPHLEFGPIRTLWVIWKIRNSVYLWSYLWKFLSCFTMRLNNFFLLVMLRKTQHTLVFVSLVSFSHPLTGVMNLPIHILWLKKWEMTASVVTVEWGERFEQKLLLLPWPCSSLKEAGARVSCCYSCRKTGPKRVWVTQQVSCGWTHWPGRRRFVDWATHFWKCFKFYTKCH